jgi:SpoVK/Ycf46/Vps4 family AAA+-type ATPase
MSKRFGKVVQVQVLEPGTEIDMDAWQISGVSSDGKIVVASLDIPEDEDTTDYTIQKGAWRISPKNGLEKVHYTEKKYYATDTYNKISKFFNNFKNNLHVFDEFGITEKKRGILLGSIPGVGKTALINQFCKELVASEPDACILSIDSNEVDFEAVQKMFRKAKPGDASFIVLILEDIGGPALDDRHSNVDSTMLNFLSGQEGLFSIPTLIVGTTNYLDSLGDTLTSRPDRFDVVVQVESPKDDECVDFLENFMRRKMTEGEKSSIRGKDFTLAYLRECAIRHRLDSIPFEEAVELLLNQRKKSANKTHAKNNVSIGFLDD